MDNLPLRLENSHRRCQLSLIHSNVARKIGGRPACDFLVRWSTSESNIQSIAGSKHYHQRMHLPLRWRGYESGFERGHGRKGVPALGAPEKKAINPAGRGLRYRHSSFCSWSAGRRGLKYASTMCILSTIDCEAKLTLFHSVTFSTSMMLQNDNMGIQRAVPVIDPLK